MNKLESELQRLYFLPSQAWLGAKSESDNPHINLITATGLAVFFVPVFFVVVRRFFKGNDRQRKLQTQEKDMPPGATAGDQI